MTEVCNTQPQSVWVNKSTKVADIYHRYPVEPEVRVEQPVKVAPTQTVQSK